MDKILIVDDDPFPEYLRDYAYLFPGNEVYHIIYLGYDEDKIARSLREEKISQFMTRWHFASSSVMTHPETVEYLRQHKLQFSRIVLDGLAGMCFQLIKEVPLGRARTEVHSGDTSIIKGCHKLGIACRHKTKDENDHTEPDQGITWDM